MTLVVLAGSIFPWLALGVTGTNVDQLYSLHDITADPEEIDPDEVADDARVGHEILLAVSATVGTLLVLFAPFAVGRGVYGTVLAAVCCLAVMFRTRQYRTGAEVLAGLTLRHPRPGLGRGLDAADPRRLARRCRDRPGRRGRRAARRSPSCPRRRPCGAAGWATSSRR